MAIQQASQVSLFQLGKSAASPWQTMSAGADPSPGAACHGPSAWLHGTRAAKLWSAAGFSASASILACSPLCYSDMELALIRLPLAGLPAAASLPSSRTVPPGILVGQPAVAEAPVLSSSCQAASSLCQRVAQAAPKPVAVAKCGQHGASCSRPVWGGPRRGSAGVQLQLLAGAVVLSGCTAHAAVFRLQHHPTNSSCLAPGLCCVSSHCNCLAPGLCFVSGQSDPWRAACQTG